MKLFTEKDVNTSFKMPRIDTEMKDLVYAPPDWMKRGRQESRTGYGSRLNSGYKINYCGKLYRIYTTIYSNSGICWFKTKGVTINVN